jgi:hypothetical protein
VEEARQLVYELNQDPFPRLEAVVNFVRDYVPTLAKIENDIVERKFAKVARNKMEWVGTLLNVAQQFVEKDVWDQALGKIEEVRGVLEEISQVYLRFEQGISSLCH